jgi:leader peptidase (prepilin peptidase)/N-methyltransferase
MMVFAKRGRNNPIPFGPYLAGAGLIALMYGGPLAAFTLSLMGH